MYLLLLLLLSQLLTHTGENLYFYLFKLNSYGSTSPAATVMLHTGEKPYPWGANLAVIFLTIAKKLQYWKNKLLFFKSEKRFEFYWKNIVYLLTYLIWVMFPMTFFFYQLYVKILFNIFNVNLNEKYDRLPTFFFRFLIYRFSRLTRYHSVTHRPLPPPENEA